MRTGSAAILRTALRGSIEAGTVSRFLSSLSARELTRLHYDFALWARDDQLPPALAQSGMPWTTWLMLGGRGAGKTRAGAEWVRSIAGCRCAHRAGRRDAGRCARRDGRGRVRAARRASAGAKAFIRAVEAAADVADQAPWRSSSRRKTRRVCAGRNSRRPGATSSANGGGRKTPGTCCNSACGWATRPGRW